MMYLLFLSHDLLIFDSVVNFFPSYLKRKDHDTPEVFLVEGCQLNKETQHVSYGLISRGLFHSDDTNVIDRELAHSPLLSRERTTVALVLETQQDLNPINTKLSNLWSKDPESKGLVLTRLAL